MKPKKQEPALDFEEWSFHKLDPDEHYACFCYERKRGDLKGPALKFSPKPWRELSPKERSALMHLFPPLDYRRPSVSTAVRPPKMSDLEQLTMAMEHYPQELRKTHDPSWKPPVEPVHLMVDWRVSNTRLFADFKKFVRDERKQPGSAAAQYAKLAKRAGTGRPRDLPRLLVDIALVRADAAGFKRLGAIELLAPLLQHFNFLPKDCDTKDGLFSEKNWSATLREAKESVKSYKLRP